jgi:hypothetical protein
MRKSLPVAGLLVAAVVPSLLAAAEPSPPPKRELLQPPKVEVPSPITDRFALRGGYFQPGVSTDLRYDAGTGTRGTPIDGEDVLGLDDELNTGFYELTFRLRPRHRLRVDYLKFSRSGDAVVDQVIRFGDDTYLVRDRVLTLLDQRALGFTYQYSVIRSERFELGAGGGVHLMQVDGEAQVPLRRLREEFDAAGPFPTLAVDGTYRITRRLAATARVQYLGFGVGDVDGSFGIYHADLQWRAWKNLAVGVGYTKVTTLVDSADSGFSGRMDFELGGPEAFVRVSF